MTSPENLIDYIFIVGPSTKLPEPHLPTDIPSIATCSPPLSPDKDGWYSICQTTPAVLWRYPKVDLSDQPLPTNIVYFCQPESCCNVMETSKTHSFMLTNTETNVRTYGLCVSFPYLVNPLAQSQSPKWQHESQDSIAIQEWSVLTVCILSRYDLYRFFERVVKTFIHFVDHFCGSQLTWDLLIHSQFVTPNSLIYKAVWELEKWVESLISLPAPRRGIEVMEVELEVDPAFVVGYPPSSRLPFVDLPVHSIFQLLDISLVIEIYKLLLLEHKVILHAKNYGFASQCVLTILTLLYPLQYLFPVIPLLPTCLPNAENLLLVPTPYLIGVPSSFLKKINELHRAEVWIVDLDKKKIDPPAEQDDEFFNKFPTTLLQLEADVRQTLDRMEEEKESIECAAEITSIEVKADVMIRIAFAEFLMGPEMLGHLTNHLSIYRLFTRPVVSLRLTSFLSDYLKGKPNLDPEFIKHFVRTQSVEYYMEWILNPTNRAFEEIKRGYCEVERVGDKLCWWTNRVKPHHLQYTLYTPDPESILYQEMLNHKARQTPENSLHSSLSSISSESDFEFVVQEDNPSDLSSYYSDEGSLRYSSSSTGCIAPETTSVAIEFHTHSSIATSPLPLFTANETFLSFQEPTHEESLSPPEHQPLPSISIEIEGETRQNGNGSENVKFTDDKEIQQQEEMDHPNVMFAPKLELDHHLNTDPLLKTPQTEYKTPTSSLDSTQYLTPSPDKPHLHLPSGTNSFDRFSPVPPGSSIPRVGSWMNLRGPLVEMLEFSTPVGSGDHNEEKNKESEDSSLSASTVVRTVPWSAVSSLHELETQIKELVGRIGAGQGLPWPKTAALKLIVSDERSRVALLRLLELRLGIRRQTNLLLSANGEIRPVVVSKAVYKGVLELLKYLLQPIETILQNDLETPLFSPFLMLRLALCVCTKIVNKKLQPKTPSLEKQEVENSESDSSLKTNGSTSTPITPHSEPVYDYNGPLLPVEIELQEIDLESVVTPTCKRVRICEPVSQSGKIQVDVGQNDDYSHQYLHTELLKGLSNAMKGIVVKRHFWNSMFSAVVQADRKYLGWNERTFELYERYDSLGSSQRQLFGYEEDTLLSIVLHNILIFLLMIGISPEETLDVCQRLSARTRLATAEEKLLQQTLSELKNANIKGSLDIKNLAVLSLYSERHPVVTYIVHHGISVTAPIFKLQVTDEVCILRRFPDERITSRFWNDCISDVTTNEVRQTVSFRYFENSGEYYHHFHSKQYHEVCMCLKTLVYKQQNQ